MVRVVFEFLPKYLGPTHMKNYERCLVNVNVYSLRRPQHQQHPKSKQPIVSSAAADAAIDPLLRLRVINQRVP